MVQGAYGDVGHGYVSVGRPWSHYRHRDIEHGLDQTAWQEYAISTRRKDDGWYGVGGICSESQAKGARAWVVTAPEGSDISRRVSRIEVHYLKQKGGGEFEVLVDKQPIARVSTDSAKPEAGVGRFDVPDGSHRIELVASTKHRTRLFGLAMERGEPGVIVDSLGIGGVSWHSMATAEPAVAKGAYSNRHYDLVAFLLGTNTVNVSTQPAAIKKVVGWVREALPDGSILIMSPPDHIRSLREARSDPATVQVVRQLAEVADQSGCAYWDFWTAMGGNGSMLTFHKKKWNQWDLYHLNPRGSAYMAARFVYALWRDFERWAKEHPEAGCETR